MNQFKASYYNGKAVEVFKHKLPNFFAIEIRNILVSKLFAILYSELQERVEIEIGYQ